MNDDLSALTSDPRAPYPSSNNDSEQAPAPLDNDVAKAGQRAQRARRAHYLDHLRRNIDIVIYCQFSILYYMDCSLLRFFIRVIPHWILFTPKPAIFPPPPSNRPYVSSIAATNGFCVLIHLLMTRPEAGEATRGYLHGGLLIDFVGELGPISRWRMILVDILILLLQVVILGVTLEKTNLSSATGSSTLANFEPQVVDTISSGPLSGLMRQDLDAEERGFRRSQEYLGDDIEMIPWKKEGEDNEGPARIGRRNEHALDVFYSGQAVIADVQCIEALRTAWRKRYGA